MKPKNKRVRGMIAWAAASLVVFAVLATGGTCTPSKVEETRKAPESLKDTTKTVQLRKNLGPGAHFLVLEDGTRCLVIIDANTSSISCDWMQPVGF